MRVRPYRIYLYIYMHNTQSIRLVCIIIIHYPHLLFAFSKGKMLHGCYFLFMPLCFIIWRKKNSQNAKWKGTKKKNIFKYKYAWYWNIRLWIHHALCKRTCDIYMYTIFFLSILQSISFRFVRMGCAVEIVIGWHYITLAECIHGECVWYRMLMMMMEKNWKA